jgi:hypothetical protein
LTPRLEKSNISNGLDFLSKPISAGMLEYLMLNVKTIYLKSTK